VTILLSGLTFDHDLATVSASRCHYYANSAKLSSTPFALGRFGYRLIARPFFFNIAWFYIHDSPGRCLNIPTISPNAASTLTFVLLCSEPANTLPTPRHQSKPTNLEKAVVCSWCETMQASGVSSRFCRASFTVRASAHLRCAESKQKRACSTKLRHIFIDNRSAVLLHHTTATAASRWNAK